VNCYACHNHIAQTNLSFTDKSKHINGIVETTVDECLGCHSTYNLCEPGDTSCIDKKLLGAHAKHTNVELFLSGKKLSTDDYTDSSWIYSIKYKGGFPQFGCGFCHPMNSATHKNGIVELDFNPNNALRGSVKTKNKVNGPWVTTYVQDQSVVCNNVYCHSNGFVSETTKAYSFVQTPDWYYSDLHGGTSPWANVDSCSQCHGNSPNTGGKEGSSAHARHVVGNHYKDVFGGYSAILKPAGAPGTGSVHGDPATATTFNCNICHYNTVRTAYNDKGSVCSSCHTTSGKGIMAVYSTGTANNEINGPGTSHVNGRIDVVFMEPFAIKSKAQLRDSLSSVQSVYSSWTRIKGYKTYSSYDLAKNKPNYVGGACSTTACHNGTLMEWRTKGPLHCSACHNGLPQ
jgi:predicted CxxxxCH...CXXCH cytochrome family protein